MGLHGVADLLETLAPASLAADWDNAGWQIRLEDARLRGVLISLDPVPTTVDEAARLGANLLVTHHPLFLRTPASLRADTLPGATSLHAVRQGVSIFTLHTNLDAAPNGTSRALAAALDLPLGEPLEKRADGQSGYGWLARSELARPLLAWRALIAERLGRPPLAVSGNLERLHQTVAVMGGSGASLIGSAAAAGATLLITADVRYHEAQAAQASGLSLLVLDHFDSEWPVLATIADFLRARLTCPISVSSSRSTPWEVLAR